MIARHRLIDTSAARVLLLLCALALRPDAAGAAVTIVIQNSDPAGVGFNDPTPVAPVGGNAGTTLGQQRLNVFQAAAAIWGSNLSAVPTIVIDAAWAALNCTANSAILGSAGATQVFSDFPGAPFAATWYPVSLADKLFGARNDPSTPQIRARFNINLGNAGCLAGVPFYLGLDNNHGSSIDLETVLLHEFTHGFGFLAFTTQAGSFLGPPFQPSVFNKFQLDTSTSKTWDIMTNAERAASTLNARKVVWTGSNVTADVPNVLVLGTPQLTTTAPPSLAGGYLVGTAAFGPALGSPGVSGEVMPLTGTGMQLLGCDPFSLANMAAVNGKLAMIDRGVCTFAGKVKNAQNAGAVGAIIVNNAAASPPPGLGGADPTIVIPAVMITQADGALFRDFLRFRSRTHSGLVATLGVDPTLRAGADAAGRALLYTPNPFISGSSVSHWDSSAFHNLLMEPNLNGDLTHNVQSPFDLTLEFLRDIGW